MTVARAESTMSTCASGVKVGAVFVRNGKYRVTSGFNGVPAGYPHPTVCKQHLDPARYTSRDCHCKHAEANAIACHGRIGGAALEGTQAYVTYRPCDECVGLLANVGVVEIIYDRASGHPCITVRNLAEKCGIKLTAFGGENESDTDAVVSEDTGTDRGC